MLKSQRELWLCCALFAAGLFVFTRGLSLHGLEYRDDEIFYYKSTQEMVQSGDILSPTYFQEDRFQKPILFYWLILFSYKIFGVNWFAARFVASVFAAFTVVLTWLIAKELFTRRTAYLSAVILMTVPLFFRHAKNAVPDMPLNFFIVLAIYCVMRFVDDPRRVKHRILFFIACGLGFMIKGFAAIVVPVTTFLIFSLSQKKGHLLKELRWGQGILILALIIAPWFVYMVVVHGSSYWDYVVVEETKNRIIGGGGNFLWMKGVAFLQHCIFYLRTILSYFAPWSPFFFASLLLAAARRPANVKERISLQWLLIWTGVVFFSFSAMHFTINHYMIALTTPFAILVSYFFMEGLDRGSAVGRFLNFSKKFFILFILGAGFLAFAFLSVFLVGWSKWLLALFILVYLLLMRFILSTPKLIVAPMCLGIFLVFVFMQSFLMGKAGLTAHAPLQKIAATIQAQAKQPAKIGVGSHDIHEKELQVYFDQQVAKAATSSEEETKAKLAEFLNTPEEVYCLLTEKDFQRYLGENTAGGRLDIVREDYIFRKRMEIDKGFFAAVLRMDRPKVRAYMMEKLILVRKDKNV